MCISDGQIPYLCDTLDEGLVTREFEYFKIPLTPREYVPEPSPVQEEIRFVLRVINVLTFISTH